MSTIQSAPQSESLLRVKQVLQRFHISKASWWLGVKEGRYPAGIKLSPRITVWRSSDIDTLIHTLSAK